jgi:hypothetical protein
MKIAIRLDSLALQKAILKCPDQGYKTKIKAEKGNEALKTSMTK